MSELTTRWVVLANLGATVYMTGVIWFVQIVHYPLFAGVDGDGFVDYERRHAALTTYVVAPPMLIEALTAVLLLWMYPPTAAAWQAWLGLGLVAVIWFSTAFLQIPCHEALGKHFDADVHQRLVSTNWIRTAAWSLRSVLMLWMVARGLRLEG